MVEIVYDDGGHDRNDPGCVNRECYGNDFEIKD